jgi:hypothetical protein
MRNLRRKWNTDSHLCLCREVVRLAEIIPWLTLTTSILRALVLLKEVLLNKCSECLPCKRNRSLMRQNN